MSAFHTPLPCHHSPASILLRVLLKTKPSPSSLLLAPGTTSSSRRYWTVVRPHSFCEAMSLTSTSHRDPDKFPAVQLFLLGKPSRSETHCLLCQSSKLTSDSLQQSSVSPNRSHLPPSSPTPGLSSSDYKSETKMTPRSTPASSSRPLPWPRPRWACTGEVCPTELAGNPSCF